MCDIEYNLNNILKYISNDIYKIVIISDTIVAPLYAAKIEKLLQKYSVITISIPAGEVNKNRAIKAEVEDQMLSMGCKRDTLIIALGGGVVTDLAGYVAATYCRGVKVIYIPTTMMAMVDAAIGGKTGINTSYGKNMIGCIREPSGILIDVEFLKTLDDSEYIYAYSEVIKHAIIADLNYFDYLENNIAAILARNHAIVLEVIKMSNKIKTDIVAKDLYDTSTRSILNFGHTYGHAIELMSNYTISHGMAVACGLYFECQEKYKDLLPRLINLFNKLGIEYTSPYSKHELKNAMMHDKKIRLGRAIY